ncbi:hypothetical protein [Veronia pacifica]|uniref:hypothetical protein n=1 Tax=Veronia pacifica TaxID=1080227 RepID=UPI00363B1473
MSIIFGEFFNAFVISSVEITRLIGITDIIKRQVRLVDRNRCAALKRCLNPLLLL